MAVKIRRKQLHEKRLKGAVPWWTRTLRWLWHWPVMVTLLFAAGASAVALYGSVSLDYAIGQRVRQPIRARVAFSVPDQAKTVSDQEHARATAPSHYALNDTQAARVGQELLRFYRAVLNADSFETFQASADPTWSLERDLFERLRQAKDGEPVIPFVPAVEKLSHVLLREYIVNDPAAESRSPSSRTDHIVVHADEDGSTPPQRVDKAELTLITSERQLDGRASALALAFPTGVREPVRQLLAFWLKKEPIYLFDAERTAAEIQQRVAAVPEARIDFARDQFFITPHPAGEDPGLSAREYELLVAEHKAYLSFLKSGTPDARAALQRDRLQQAGTVTLIAFLAIGLFVYVGQHEPRILQNQVRSFALAGLMLGLLAVTRLIDMRWSADVPELVLAPCLLVGSIVAIVYPRRFAIGAMCIVGVTAALILRRDLVFAVTLLTGLVVNGFQLHDIRTRTQIIVSGLVTGASVAAASFAGSMIGQEALIYARDHAVWAFGCAMSAAFVFWGLLPFLERICGIATPLTLLELFDSRQPLLQLLAREAPGTHKHSLALSTLADASCKAIGADGLLASVGALYHDVGKIPKAHYFTENQQALKSRHADLAPTMSLLIIVAHVKDGVEMAREYKLPRILHPFILEHHGTTVVRYFHHLAAEKQPTIASGRHDREVPESEFRYPGPKPHTRETAVLMLCDGVEGAVRALKEPTPGRIESVVHQLVMDRLNDGQFDECDITLNEIRMVEESLVKTLASLYHGRVAYPGGRKAEEPRAEAPAEPPRAKQTAG